jgi:hypothetical protein
VIEIHRGLEIPAGAHDLAIVGESRTVLRAAREFQGRALISLRQARQVALRGFTLEGNRDSQAGTRELAPPENAFRLYYSDNGVLADEVEDLRIEQAGFHSFAGFPILVSRSRRVAITGVSIRDSGSKNRLGRNNSTGGILLEEGTVQFEVRSSNFYNITGNGLWTHSLYTSPRNGPGILAFNRFRAIGRDAIQVGHATRVRVESNTGSHIGYPSEIVDVEGGGFPVAIDTAGNVDSSQYRGNVFRELNGKCFDLDGFHHGEVSGNTCLNTATPEAYPFGHFGIVLNNSNPDMQSAQIRIIGNQIQGMKYGGLFLIGRDHQVIANRFSRVNTSGCNESGARFNCNYFPNEPNLLQSGIYLSRGVGRYEPVRGNVIRGNTISGHGMQQRCVAAGPGVRLTDNVILENRCSEE